MKIKLYDIFMLFGVFCLAVISGFVVSYLMYKFLI
jgi:hypothetical protein